jgi:glycyl-tRNA synthetase
MNKNINMLDKIISFAKRRGFVYPSSEIYGGFSAIYDFGPYGALLAKNIKDYWWKKMTQEQENIVGLDSAIFMSPKVWEASGHVSGLSDPLMECKNCNARLRADTLLEEVGVFADEKMPEKEIVDIFLNNQDKLRCPNCGKQDFSKPKNFNLLVKSNLGNFTGDWEKDPVYLRGETAQGIYINYKNVMDTTRVKIPFGIAQIGKAFRNEITARQFIFRTREFEQMEMQYFIHPDMTKGEYDKLKKERWQFYLDLGIKEDNLRWYKHEKLAFYAKEAYDIEYNYPFGFKELEGVHVRGDHDLSQHSKHSGKSLEYLDPESKEKYIPHVIEASGGVGRTFLAVICDAYHEEDLENDTRVVLKIDKKIAPIKVAIFPLLKNKEKLFNKAKEIYNDLKKNYYCEFDSSGNIGKRYRRQDEIGTPYCVTVDFDSLENNDVTVRDRDNMEQERVKIEDLKDYLDKGLFYTE